MSREVDDDLNLEDDELVITANKAFAAAESGGLIDPLDLIKSSIDLANQTHRPVLSTLQAFSSALPPLKIVVTAIIALWEIVHAAFIDRQSTQLTRAGKIGLSLALIGVGIAAVAAAPVAGVLFIVAAGISLGKELLNFGTAITHYIGIKELTRSEVNPHKKELLSESVKDKRNEVIEKGMSVLLAVASVAGFAMLITPLAPVGLGLLIATSVVGMSMKVAPMVTRKLAPTFSLIKEKISNLFSIEKDSEETPTPSEKEKEGRKISPSIMRESTAKLSQELSSGNPEEEIKKGLKEAHAQPNIEKQTPPPVFKKETKLVIDDETPDDEEKRGVGYHKD